MDSGVTGSSPRQEIKLADYSPPAFLIKSTRMLFRINEQSVRVTATSDFYRSGDGSPDLVLDGGPYMSLVSLTLDGVQLNEEDYEINENSLLVRSVPDKFQLQIETELLPFENSRLEGLYASGGNLCTQCEAEGFRHITYFLDRPDVLATYDVRIEASKNHYPVLLSNGNLVKSGSLPDGRHFAEWRDPHPKPCYLFALVAGNLAAVSDSFTTKSGRDVNLNIYVRAPDLDKCDHAMQSLKRSMAWDEEVFGLEYDLDTYNIVAVSDFNMGAMENKGLNIFNTKYVLANAETATDSDFDHVEGVIGHEYFHNWTGNRVTCRDWFQLSLKEGLTVFRDQEFSSDMTSRAVKRIDDVRVLRMLQFPEDAGPLAHPVRPESYIEINNFYTVTVYNKGAEVIRMMRLIVGESAFLSGVRLYLSRHDGQAVTCEDFVVAMEDASGVDLTQFRLWYSQAGTPVVEASRHFRNGVMELTLKQSCPPTPGQHEKAPFQIPVKMAWLDGKGAPIRPRAAGEVKTLGDGFLLNLFRSEQTFTFEECPEDAVPSLLQGFSAPIKLQTDLSNDDRTLLFARDTDSFARWQAGQDMYAEYLLADLSGNRSETAEGQSSLGSIINAVGAVLGDQGIEPAFAAELLTLPSEIYLGQLQQTLDPEGLFSARNRLLKQIVEQHWSTIKQKYFELTEKAVGTGQTAKSSRKLRNLLLGLIANSEHQLDQAKPIVVNHFECASNMTDQYAGLLALCHSGWKEREDALSAFYQQWHREELVVDKWFSAQAIAPDADALKVIPGLMEHPAFSITNPNRLRSVISMFAMMNQRNFHALDGSGYNLLSRTICKVDKINPQTAARLVAPLGRWNRLDADRRALMRQSLSTLQQQQDLSDDVRELVEKSLR